MRRYIKFSYVITSILIIFLFGTTTSASGTTSPSIEFTVQPSQSEIVKPSNGNAEGVINVNLQPKGKATSANREPIDVVFIFDKSGSMNESGKKPEKFQSAKDAMTEAVSYFKEHAGPNDKFAFIPFASEVEENKVVYFSPTNVQTGLNLIQSTVNNLTAVGGTNYTQSFEKAMEILQGSGNKNKSIIFMTDGEPTFSQNKEMITYDKVISRKCVSSFLGMCLRYEDQTETVTEEVLVHYEVYTNGTTKVYYSLNGKTVNRTTSLNDTNKAIRQHGVKRAGDLADRNIKMYSIGFGNNQEVDMTYLRELSAITGVTARQASEGNITSIFREISENIDIPTINGEVKIDLKKFNGKVNLIEGSGARLDQQGMATLRFSANYPINQGTPQPIDLALPLSFTEIGTYTFDKINLVYTDLTGNQVTKSHAPITIQVKADAPPTFRGTMELAGVINTPDNLIKNSVTNARTNEFNVTYNLLPQGLVNNTVSGTLSNIVITQPLPDGVSIISSSSVTPVTLEDGRKAARISLSNVSYGSGNFNPKQLTATLNLKGDWALNNVKMPLASVSYQDSRFGNQTTTITPSNQIINMKVRLEEFSNKAYEGDAAGIINKIDLADNGKRLAQTEFPNNYGLKNKAIKDMVFLSNSKNKTIEITYFDNDKAYVYLVADFELRGKDTRQVYNSGDTAEEFIEMKLTHLVAGKGVKYYYAIDNNIEKVNWTEFMPEDTISIKNPGLNKVMVKTEGGFSISQSPIEKLVTITKKITSISVTPNPINLDIGSSVGITITVLPVDATNQDLDITTEDHSIATIVNQRVVGVAEGDTNLIVKTKDGSNISVVVPIKVINPYVALKEVKFKKAKFSLKLDEEVFITDFIIFNPSNATKKELTDVLSTMSKKVEVFKENGNWKIRAKEIGFSTVTVKAYEPKTNHNMEDSAIFEITPKQADDGKTNNSTDGKW